MKNTMTLMQVTLLFTTIFATSCGFNIRNTNQNRQSSFRGYNPFVRIHNRITEPRGELSARVAGGNPEPRALLEGYEELVGQFKFEATGTDFDIQKLKFQLSGDAMLVSSIGLRYKDEEGVEIMIYQPVAGTYAIFTDLQIHVPQDGDVAIEVFAELMTFQSSGVLGNDFSITMLHDEGFRAVDSAGRSISSYGNHDVHTETFPVYRSLPYVSVDRLDHLGSGSYTALLRFKMGAHVQGDILWKKLSFRIDALGVSVSDFNLREFGGVGNINTAPLQLDESGVVEVYAGSLADESTIEIQGGFEQTYELYANVRKTQEYGFLLVELLGAHDPLLDRGSVADLERESVVFMWSDQAMQTVYGESGTNESDWLTGRYVFNLAPQQLFSW